MSTDPSVAFMRPDYVDNKRPRLLKLIPKGVSTCLDIRYTQGGFRAAWPLSTRPRTLRVKPWSCSVVRNFS